MNLEQNIPLIGNSLTLLANVATEYQCLDSSTHYGNITVIDNSNLLDLGNVELITKNFSNGRQATGVNEDHQSVVYRCDYCSTHFSDGSLLEQHLVTEHKLHKGVDCNRQSIQTETTGGNSHQHQQLVFQCANCPLFFPTASLLEQHHFTQHKDLYVFLDGNQLQSEPFPNVQEISITQPTAYCLTNFTDVTLLADQHNHRENIAALQPMYKLNDVQYDGGQYEPCSNITTNTDEIVYEETAGRHSGHFDERTDVLPVENNDVVTQNCIEEENNFNTIADNNDNLDNMTMLQPLYNLTEVVPQGGQMEGSDNLEGIRQLGISEEDIRGERDEQTPYVLTELTNVPYEQYSSSSSVNQGTTSGLQSLYSITGHYGTSVESGTGCSSTNVTNLELNGFAITTANDIDVVSSQQQFEVSSQQFEVTEGLRIQQSPVVLMNEKQNIRSEARSIDSKKPKEARSKQKTVERNQGGATKEKGKPGRKRKVNAGSSPSEKNGEDVAGDKEAVLHQCPYCPIKFTEASILEKHIQRHDNVFFCDYCKQKFTDFFRLEMHIRVHMGQNPYVCKYCNVNFTQLSSLKNHIRVHTERTRVQCIYCKSTFFRAYDLKKHLRLHTGDKPHECTRCGKRFTQNAHLQYHMRTHTGDKRFKCDYCFDGFARASAFFKHVANHIDKPNCVHCDANFEFAPELKEHFQNIHRNNSNAIIEVPTAVQL